MLKKEFRDLSISIDNYNDIKLTDIKKGQYTLRVVHQCQVLYEYPRSLFMSFAIDDTKDDDIKYILGLNSISEEYGVFVYLGGGNRVGNYYIQEVCLDIASDIPNLNLQLRTFSRKTDGRIAALQIYDNGYLKCDLFGFSQQNSNIFFVSNLITHDITNFIENKIGELNSIFFVDKDHDSFIENSLFLNNHTFKNEDVILLYSQKKFDKHYIESIKTFFPNAIFVDKQDLGLDKDLSGEQELELFKIFYDLLKTESPVFINNLVLFEKLILENINTERFFVFSEEEYNHFLFKNITLNKDKYSLLDGFTKRINAMEGETLKVSFSVVNNKQDELSNSALVVIRYIGKDNNFILPPSNFGVNPIFGTYNYVLSSTIASPDINEINIEIPKNSGIQYIDLEFKSWGKEHIENYLDMSSFNVVSDSSKLGVSNADQFIETLSPKDKIILIYTTAPYIGHETLELRPNRLTKEYIKLGYKVIFFAFSRVPEELKYPNEYNGQLLQCHKDELLEYVSLISRKKLEDKIFICSSFPDIFALTAITRLKQFGDWKLSYEIRDDMEEFNRVGYSKWYTTQLEINVARSVDKIVTVSPRLASKIKVMSGKSKSREWDKKVRVIQNAAPDILISKSEYLRSENFFEQKTKSQTVGYIGHLTPAWFDWTLILTAARDFPHINFEIIGHGMPKTLELPSNVVYLGPKDHDSFLKISEKWKVGLIPFITSPLTYGVDPNKIYEYLAANLLVVTADMGSVKECPATYVYEDYQGFKKGLEAALKVQYNHSLLKSISEYVEVSRWSNRAQKMLEFIHKEI